ncbi:MAG: metallophosphoesterase [Clostridia bacterium]|nr:metallophosphoesterase [Clostridia bacterium]
MIYFLSDVHENINFVGLQKYLEIATKNDLLIILGDIGLNFSDNKENRNFTEKFLRINKNIAFIEGNHENFAFLDGFPVEEWKGGKVNRISKNIVRLMRGNIYDIDERKFFAFGGCKSSPKWKEMGLWHYGEEPTKEEFEFAILNLKKHNNNVDFVLTHKYDIKGQGTNSELLMELCSYIDKNVAYKKWISGHWHKQKEYDSKHLLVYDNLVPITEI